MSGMKLTVIGCSGSYPGPDSSASCYLLEADRTTPAAPGGSCSTSATGPSGRCSATPTRPTIDARLPLPPARRPLPRPVRLLRACASTTPAARCRGSRSTAPSTARRAAGEGLRPRRGPGDERGVRLHPLRHHEAGVRTLLDHRARGGAPGRRRSPCASRPRAGPSPTPATAVSAPASTTPPVAPTCSCARRRSSRARPTRPTCTSPGPRPGARPPMRGCSACCSPTSRRGTTRRWSSARRSSEYDGKVELATPGTSYEV